jgi:glycosyltransferase involved in cell wall biosynthesis
VGPLARPRTLLYFTPWIDLGGTDRAAVDWFETLDRKRFRAILVTTLPSANPSLHAVLPYADEVWPLPDLMPGSEYPRFLLDLVATRGVELVHASNARLPLALLPDLAALAAPPRVVLQLHEAREDGLSRYAAARYDSLIDAYSVVSPAIAALLDRHRVSPAKVRHIPLGIDVHGRFDPAAVAPRELPPERFNVLWPARITDQKDPLLLARVIGLLAERLPAATVHVVGEGPLAPELRRAVAGFDGGVRLHGAARADEMPGWYRGADAVLLTSRYEGVPLTLAEAFALERPVVAPAIAGITALADPGCARLVAPRDDPAAYAAALAELAGSPELCARLGEAGRRRVAERFTRELAARSHAALYEELLAP